VLYELLGGERAFPGESTQVVLSNIASKEPRPIRDLVPGIDPALERILRRGLRKNAADRYQTLLDFAADLERVRLSLLSGSSTTTQVRGGDTQPLPPDRPIVPGQQVGSASGPGSSQGTPTPAPRRLPNLEAIAQRRVAQVETALREAADLFKTGQYEDVIHRCEHALLIEPNEGRALEMLDLAHRAIEVREVQQWLDEAQSLVAAEELTQADALVARALERQPDSARAQAVLRELQQRKRERDRLVELRSAASLEVAKARVHFEAGAFEEAVRAARQALSFDPDDEEARRLIQIAKAAIDDRARWNEHELKARETVRLASQFVDAQDFEAALAALKAFTPPHPIVTDTILSVERHLRGSTRRAEDEQERTRPAAEERRRRAMVPADNANAQPDPYTGGLAATRKRGSLAAWEAGTPGEAEEAAQQGPWYQRPQVLVRIAAATVTVLVAVWWTSGTRTTPGPEVPVLDLNAKTLGAAEADYRRGNVMQAVTGALSIPAGTAASQAAVDLLNEIRRDQREAALRAKDEAEKAGHANEREFKEAWAEMQSAESVTSVRMTDRVIAAYRRAYDLFKQAANAGLNTRQLMDRATRAYASGNTHDAIADAVQVLVKDPRNKLALDFLRARRDEKRSQALDAQKKALESEPKADSPDMAAANERLKSAESTGIGRETPKAIGLYGEAIVYFDRARNSALAAATAAAADRDKQRTAVEATLKTALAEKDVTRAKAELDRLRQLNAPGVADWSARIAQLEQQLRNEDAQAKQAEDKRRADDLYKRALGTTDAAEARKLLEQAAALAPENAEIKQEQARRAAKPATPPAISSAKDDEDIRTLLSNYVGAFNQNNLDEMRRLCTAMPSPVIAFYQKAFEDKKARNLAHYWAPIEGTQVLKPALNRDVRDATWSVVEKKTVKQGVVSETPVHFTYQVRRTALGTWTISGCQDPRVLRLR
jgi:hypothetical protein